MKRALSFLFFVTACGSAEASSNDATTTPSIPAPTTTPTPSKPADPAEKCPAVGGERPTVVSSGRIEPRSVTVDGDRLIWEERYATTGTGAILTCPAKGCVHEPEIIAEGTYSPDNLVVDEAGIFWSDNSFGGVRSCPRTGACTSPKVVVASTRVYGLAVAEGALYFTKFVDPSTQTYLDGAIATCSATTESASQPLLVTAQNRPENVVIDGDAMFWNSIGTPPSFTDGALLTCPKAGCATPVVIADHLALPEAFTTDAGNVYWTGKGGVFRCAKTGCGAEGPVALATLRSNPHAIKVAGDRVYWTESGASPSYMGGVYSAPIAPSSDACLAAPKVIAEEQQLPTGLAVDASHVYWTTYDGNVLSAPR